ncbi:ArsR/SmtB family transcription factor [Thalassospira australica]|uniref:ArsR/SmtB family transcription factor n=1 Tax=Thalassospira australica TaxID=1528106 RepID=UPI00068CB866|nr:metalloregulator ArsR/SmtB family transcription factor [Thalassospira australica]
MIEKDIAPAFAALGHEARLKIYRQLVKAGDDGLNIGDIGRLLDLPASTLAHHLGTLVQAGLVHQEKHGRETRNRADFDVMRDLLGFIADECCSGVDLGGGAALATATTTESETVA